MIIFVELVFIALLLSAERVCGEPDVVPLFSCPKDLVVGVNKTTFLNFGGRLSQHPELTLTHGLPESSSPMIIFDGFQLNKGEGYHFVTRLEHTAENGLNIKISRTGYKHSGEYHLNDEIQRLPRCSTKVEVLGNPICVTKKIKGNYHLIKLNCSLNYAGPKSPKLRWNDTTLCQSPVRQCKEHTGPCSAVCYVDIEYLSYVACEVYFDEDLMKQNENGTQSIVRGLSTYSSCRKNKHKTTSAASTLTRHAEEMRVCDQPCEHIRRVIENATSLVTYMERRIMRKVENITIVMQMINELKIMMADVENDKVIKVEDRMNDKVGSLMKNLEDKMIEKAKNDLFCVYIMLLLSVVFTIPTSVIVALSKYSECRNRPSSVVSRGTNYTLVPSTDQQQRDIDNNNKRSRRYTWPTREKPNSSMCFCHFRDGTSVKTVV